MVPVGDPEVLSSSPSGAADTPRQAHAFDHNLDAESREAGQTTDSSSSTVSDLSPFGSGKQLLSTLLANCFGDDGDYTTGARLFPGSQDAADTYAWALASGEAQAGVPCFHGGDSPSTCQKCFVQARSERVWAVPRGGQCQEGDKNKKRNRVRRQRWGDGEPYPYPPRDNRRPPGPGSLPLSAAGSGSGDAGDQPRNAQG